jgi:hypothetical protein
MEGHVSGRRFSAGLAACFGFLSVSLWPPLLLAACPPAGTYEWSWSWSPSNPRGCQDQEIMVSVFLNTPQPVQALTISIGFLPFYGAMTVKSLSPGIDVPTSWIVQPDHCTEADFVTIGLRAAPNPQDNLIAIPPGSHREIFKATVSPPPIPVPDALKIVWVDTTCNGAQFVNHFVVDGCDLTPVPQGASWLLYGGTWYLGSQIPFNTCYFFRRGDCNNNGLTAGYFGDIVFLLCYLFGGCPCSSPPCYQPACEAACDANDDGAVELSDAVYLVNWMFLDGPAPPQPYPDCGPDPTEPSLSCLSTICP